MKYLILILLLCACSVKKKATTTLFEEMGGRTLTSQIIDEDSTIHIAETGDTLGIMFRWTSKLNWDTWPVDSFAYDRDSVFRPHCKAGWSYMPSLSTSSLRIIADTCLPDSICKKYYLIFAENVCGETQSAGFSRDKNGRLTGGGNTNYWLGDSIGCVTINWKYIDGKQTATLKNREDSVDLLRVLFMRPKINK